MKPGSHEELMELVAEVQAFQGSEALLRVLGLLDCLEAGYKEQLVDVEAAGLARVQAACQQVRLLRGAILDGSSPRL